MFLIIPIVFLVNCKSQTILKSVNESFKLDLIENLKEFNLDSSSVEYKHTYDFVTKNRNLISPKLNVLEETDFILIEHMASRYNIGMKYYSMTMILLGFLK